jgi:hypothetical protein
VRNRIGDPERFGSVRSGDFNDGNRQPGHCRQMPADRSRGYATSVPCVNRTREFVRVRVRSLQWWFFFSPCIRRI